MLEQGYIKIHRSLQNWRWYKYPKTLQLWLHLLQNTNYEPFPIADKTIERGQMVTSFASLSDQTGQTVKEIRTSLDRLKKTGEISVWSNRHMTVITINEYDQYQSDFDTQKADQGQTKGKQKADSGQTEGTQRATMEESKERKESKEEKKEWRATLPPDTGLSNELLSAVTEWLVYKHERREDYKATGLKSLLTQIKGKADTHGDGAVCTVIRLSMSNNWKGIIWDRMETSAPVPQSYDYGGNSL